MSFYEDVGEVSTYGECTIRWTIPRYLETPQGSETELSSPYFTFCGEDGCELYAYSNRWERVNTEGWMGVGCYIPSLPLGTTITCSMLDSEGRQVLHSVMTKDARGPLYRQEKWIQQTDIQRWRGEILPGGQLSILCKVVLPFEGGQSAEGSECGVLKLIQDFKDLYVHGEDYDLTIQVGERKFRAHRCVVKARIPPFGAMLTHDMAENNKGLVKIEDCDPEVFHEFLLFVYSGKIDNFSPYNLRGLFVLGDKYCLPDLKSLCLDLIINTLSVDTVCDAISLAVTHGEAKLLRLATDFFVKNSEDVLRTVKWQVFMEQNLSLGTELFLKTVQFLKTKRT